MSEFASLKVSIVVPTFRRPSLLEKCMKTLLKQALSPADYEIIIVSDGPDWQTRLYVQRTALQNPEFHIRILELERRKGPAAARNLGWRSAYGELILFTDDDCLVDYYWAQQLWRAHIDDRKGVFSGRVIVPVTGTPTDYEKSISNLEKAFFVTANCACPKNILEITGGFDEHFGSAWREDSDLYFTFVANGYAVMHVDKAVVIHPVRKASWGVSLQLEKKNQYDALLYRKHPMLFKKYIRQQPEGTYYAAVISFLLFAICLLLHYKLPALISALCWISLTLRFALKRLSGTKHSPDHVAEMIFTSFLIPFLSVFWTLYGSFRYRKMLF